MPRLIVAIDGPAGAGKSTVTRRLARSLGYTFLDTGAMYRAVALLAARAGILWDDEARLTALAESTRFEFDSVQEPPRLAADGVDISDSIRTPEISHGASIVSQWPGVRRALVAQQRRLAATGGVVVEGRDVGTVVFPDAEVKVFLTATPAERARRRQDELLARGEQADLAAVLRDVEERDLRDAGRVHSPLRPAEDAIEIYTDAMPVDAVVADLVRLVRERESQA